MSNHFPSRWRRLSVCLMGLWLCPAAPGYPRAPTLSLHEAEQMALAHDPVTKQRLAEASALRERAIADDQLPDPQLSFGIAEVPIPGFEIGRNPDTELQLGLSQSFPRGSTLRYQSEGTKAMAAALTARAEDRRRSVRKAVRTAYLEMFYQTRARATLAENRDLFAEMQGITERRYAAGRDNQHEVLRAQLDLSLLDERLDAADGGIELARAELAKWTAPSEAERPLPVELPELPDLPAVAAFLSALACHPLMQAENAMLEASRKSVAVAGEQYKPGWNLSLLFADRTSGGFADNTNRDFLSAMVTVDLPLFRDKRQDRTLAARQDEHAAAQFAQAHRLRELTRRAQGDLATWRQLGKRLDLYRRRAAPEAAENAKATFSAYQNGITDFTTLVRARMTALEVQLGSLRVQIERAKTQAKLLYLAGDCP